MDELRLKAEKLLLLRDRKQRLQEQLNETNQEIDKLYAEMQEIFLARGMSSVSYEDIGTFSVAPQVRANIRNEDIPKLDLWLESQGAESIVRSTVNRQTLSAMVRQWMEEGKEIPDFIQVYVQPRINIRRR